MIDNIASFYNNLFTAEITAFGIIAAVILVYLQLFYSQFSYKHVSVIFRTKLFIASLTVSIIALVCSGLASALMALPSHDFVPAVDFDIQEHLLRGFAPVTLLGLFALAIILFLMWIILNMKYLRPGKILSLVAKRIKQKKLKEYVLKKYGICQPQGQCKINTLKNSNEETLSFDVLYIEDIEESVKKRYERIKKRVAGSTDPFEPLSSIVAKAMKDSDLTTIDDFCEVLVKISDEFINTFAKESVETAEWYPDVDVLEKYLRYIADYLEMLIEISDKYELTLGKLKLLQTSESIAKQIVQHNKWSELVVLLKFWNRVGDDSIGRSREAFLAIVNSYKEMGNCAFENNNVDGNESLNEIFRCLGWLGEKLLKKEGLEDKSLMWSIHDSTIFDELMEKLLSFEHEYCNKYNHSYPLRYFDAVKVIFDQLLELYSKNKIAKTSIVNCVFVFYSFGKAAILVGNEDGAALATLKLESCYTDSLTRRELDIAIEICRLLVEFGAHAATMGEKLCGKNFLNSRLDDYCIKLLSEKRIPDFNYEINLERTVVDIVVTGEDNNGARFDFVKKLDRELGTNFGLNFDWRA